MISPDVLKNSGAAGVVGATVLGAFAAFAPRATEPPSDVQPVVHFSETESSEVPTERPPRAEERAQAAVEAAPEPEEPADCRRTDDSTSGHQRDVEARNRAARAKLRQLGGIVQKEPSSGEDGSKTAGGVTKSALKTVIDVAVTAKQQHADGDMDPSEVRALEKKADTLRRQIDESSSD
ncbi:MAG: hypothetical protein ABEL76_04195 [Bradymonadaceae bacterium]